MKTQITATIDDKLLGELRRHAQRERLTRSQIIEMALEDYLLKHGAENDGIVTSERRFTGAFSREETYSR